NKHQIALVPRRLARLFPDASRRAFIHSRTAPIWERLHLTLLLEKPILPGGSAESTPAEPAVTSLATIVLPFLARRSDCSAPQLILCAGMSRVFLSYSRSNEDFAFQLRQRLATEAPDISLWHDRD